MTLFTFERQGEIAETCIPNISGVFIPEMIKELRQIDPDFVAHPDSVKTHRVFIEEDGHIPFAGMVDANLVFVIVISGSRRLRTSKNSIGITLGGKLRGVLHPLNAIHVVLVTE